MPPSFPHNTRPLWSDGACISDHARSTQCLLCTQAQSQTTLGQHSFQGDVKAAATHQANHVGHEVVLGSHVITHCQFEFPLQCPPTPLSVIAKRDKNDMNGSNRGYGRHGTDDGPLECVPKNGPRMANATTECGTLMARNIISTAQTGKSNGKRGLPAGFRGWNASASRPTHRGEPQTSGRCKTGN